MDLGLGLDAKDITDRVQAAKLLPVPTAAPPPNIMATQPSSIPRPFVIMPNDASSRQPLNHGQMMPSDASARLLASDASAQQLQPSRSAQSQCTTLPAYMLSASPPQVSTQCVMMPV